MSREAAVNGGWTPASLRSRSVTKSASRMEAQ